MIRELLQTTRGIYISILFLSLFFDMHFGKKQGNFGILTSCVMKDKTLKIECYYPPCDDSTPYQCSFTKDTNELLGSSTKHLPRNDSFFNRTNGVCHLLLKETAYTPNCTLQCTLSRRKSTQTLTVKHGTGKEMPKPCSSSELLMHEAQGLLWSIALHTLLRIFS